MEKKTNCQIVSIKYILCDMNLQDIKSLRNKVHDTTKCSPEEMEFLPLSHISDLLNHHPLMKVMNVSKMEVHKCLMYMYTHKRRQASCQHKNKETLVEDQACCKHCSNGKLISCPRDGDYICASCGVVQCKLYSEHTPFFKHDEIRHGDVDNNVPQWMITHNAIGDVWGNLLLKRDIEHWNAYVHLPTDRLQLIKTQATWMEKRASNESRIAASFLFEYMQRKIDIKSIDRDNFPHFKYEECQPYSKCMDCGEEIYSLCEKNKHTCYHKKKRERKQWSLVKNKKCKIQMM